MFCVAALAAFSSCSKEEELTEMKWICTYNEEFYGHFTENQFMGTEWLFSNVVADEDLHYYYLYINGTQVGSYYLNTYASPNFYEITERSIESTEYNEIVEYLMNYDLSIEGNTLKCEDYLGEPIISWTKM